ncbi:hypothetical protein [Salinigranum halophilum]|uniref:hypothetical protein n=1 Tax=Salinigranum halophilum TaxID=2565931 RepID=UPI00115C7735|nr:hypothetical protein [Salinigranum halophilum]
MALFRRNVVGTEVLSMWRYVSHAEPVTRKELIQRYYPGDASNPNESDQRKPLVDAIDFLIDTRQFLEHENGLVITDAAREEVCPEVSILRGIRTATGEDAAYNDVLDVLTEDDQVFFDRGDPLVDLLSGRRSDVSWNSTRLNYWRRMMDAIGVVRDVDADSDEDYTTMLSLHRELLNALLRSVMEPSEPAQLSQVLNDLHEEYLPVYAGANRNSVAAYIERALSHAQAHDDVNIGQESDFGPTVDLNGAGVNLIALRVRSQE